MINVFAHIKNGSRMEAYEIAFMKETGKEYEEYLYDEYITKNKVKKTIAANLGISLSKVSNHLRNYDIIKEDYTIEYKENNDGIYYKTIGMIEKETGKPFVETYNELLSQGLTVTQMAKHLQLKSMASISAHLHYTRREKERKENKDKLIVKDLAGKMPKVVEKMFKEQTGIEIKDFLKQKYIDEGLSLQDISDLIGISPRRLSDKVRAYGLSKSLKQIRQDAIKRGTINYTEINKKSRISRIKHGSGSTSQDMFRELIKHHLELSINEFEGIEIITGYNEYCVLDNLEVDIPIIIFYKDNVTKIAIEYNGDHWHDKKNNDELKEQLLKERKWQLISVEETRKDSGKLSVMENKAKELVNSITNILRNL